MVKTNITTSLPLHCRRREVLFSARNFDFFDSGVMERVREGVDRLQRGTEAAGPGPGEGVRRRVDRVLARRTDPATGRPEVLVRWAPADV